jgi:hypothetical protein
MDFLQALRNVGANIPRPVQKVVKAVPFLGDVINVGGAFLDPKENLRKNALDALLVGGGGALTSAATAGIDAIPALANLVVSNLPRKNYPTDIRKALNDAEYALHHADVANWLQSGADQLYYKKTFGVSPDAREKNLAAYLNPAKLRDAQQTQQVAQPAPTGSNTGVDAPKQPNTGTVGDTSQNLPGSYSQLRFAVTPDNVDQITEVTELLRVIKSMEAFNKNYAAPALN